MSFAWRFCWIPALVISFAVQDVFAALARQKRMQTETLAFHPFQSVCGGVRFLFSLPPDLKPGASPHGLFVMFHGCQRTAESFFSLPEESAMTAAVLQRGFAVAAPDSAPRHPKDCWEVGADGHIISQAIQQARANPALQKAPLYGVGISSGGELLASLVSNFKVPFSGVVINMSPHNPNLFSASNAWPRTSFVYAQGDTWASPDKVQVAARLLQQRGTPVQVLGVGPKSLDELPSHSLQLGISSQTLSFVVDLLRKAGFTKVLPDPTVGSATGTFLAPQKTDLAFEYLRGTTIANAIGSQGESLREAMHILAGIHGPTSEHFEKVLDFILDQNQSQPVATLVNTTRK